MPPISNQFSDRFIRQVVNRAYNEVGAGESIPMSKGAKNQMGHVDTNRDGRLSRDELVLGMTKGGVKLSFENEGRPNHGLARDIIGYMDAADGIRGGQIRTSNAYVSAEQAAQNLATGRWTLGKAFETADKVNTLEIHQNADGPKITLP